MWLSLDVDNGTQEHPNMVQLVFTHYISVSVLLRVDQPVLGPIGQSSGNGSIIFGSIAVVTIFWSNLNPCFSGQTESDALSGAGVM